MASSTTITTTKSSAIENSQIWSSAVQEPVGGDTRTTFYYLPPDVPHFNHLTAESSTVQKLTPYEAVVHDIRGKEHTYTIHEDGFQYVKHEMPTPVADWKDPKQIAEIVVPAHEELIKKVTGATEVYKFLHRVRTAGAPQANRQDGPAYNVHGDGGPGNVAASLRAAGCSEDDIKRLVKRRYSFIIVWRPINHAVWKDPLALCEWRSVHHDRDVYYEDVRNPLGPTKFAQLVQREEHNWLYLSGQRPDEVLMFKAWDSDPQKFRNILHSAFPDYRYENFPARESIETKFYCFYDEE